MGAPVTLPSFKAGNLRECYHEWAKLTSDTDILQTVKGYNIAFGEKPVQNHLLKETKFTDTEQSFVQTEVKKLLAQGVIEHTSREEGDFISPIFLRPKKNGEHRMILNLKELNQGVEYHHFKMDTFESALKLITPGCYMALMDIENAYYSISIDHKFRKYLKFKWDGQLFQFCALPNGLSSGPRKFTKLMKPVYAALRKLGHTICGFIDDSLIIGDSPAEVTAAVHDTLQLLAKLGFTVNFEKSILSPTQVITYLGFCIDSINMQVSLPDNKAQNIKHECQKLAKKNSDIIRNVAKMIGTLVASLSAVELGQLHYRSMEREKIFALRDNNGDFDCHMTISLSMKEDLEWWIQNIDYQKRQIIRDNPDIILSSDASMEGWGSQCGTETTGGRWSDTEKLNHINYLELLAAFLAIKCFMKDKSNAHVQLLMDNTTAIKYINSMGGVHSPLCNKLAREMWQWAINKGLWISASFIPGKTNISADFESRHFKDNTEWALSDGLFAQLVAKWGKPEIDLFATRLNAKLSKYVSWRRDPHALHIDAFSLPWSVDSYYYIFPPFSLVARCLQKLRQDQSRAIMIVPFWPTQPWFSRLLHLITDIPLVIPAQRNILYLPHSQDPHPLWRKLNLLACQLSGKISDTKTFQQGLPTLSCRHGSQARTNNITHMCNNGLDFVLKDKLIIFDLI